MGKNMRKRAVQAAGGLSVALEAMPDRLFEVLGVDPGRDFEVSAASAS